MRLAVVALVTAVLLLPQPAVLRAQVIQGVLIDNVTQLPLPATFVTLTDDAGRELGRAMTTQDGRFVLEAPGRGSYRLRCKRIGFRPQVSALLPLERGQRLTYRLALDPIPIPLASLVIEGDRQCTLGNDTGGQAVAALWEEIREALSAVSWSTRVPGYWYETSLFERDRSSSGGRVRRDSTWSRTGFLRTPFRSAPPEELAAQGYVIKDGGDLVYFAPDADALLSDPFVKTHCFEVKLGRGEESGLVGLAFSPTPDRYVSDVRGTLWLDRQTSELRSLEFAYTLMPHELRESGAGGRIEFLRLPSGAWIVRDWVIRMPLVHATGPMSVREGGGRALTIKSREGAVIYATDLAILEGTVFDSTTGVRLRDAVVAVVRDTPPAPPVAPAPRTRAAPRRVANVLSLEEIERSSAVNAYDLVQQLRPIWLHTRGPISIRDPNAGQVVAYVDGMRYGAPSALQSIPAGDVREIRFLNATAATQRYGTGHAGGVIEVVTR